MDVLDTAFGLPAPPSAAPRARAAALVRDVILGGQDGLVNVLGLVLGMAVATGDARLVVTAGLAALLAESIAMGGVAFTASGAERQLAATTRVRVGREQVERAALRALERRRRLEAGGATVAAVDAALDEADREARAWQEELDSLRTEMAPLRETRPIRAAAVVGLSTAAGSAVPLLPFVLLPIGIAPVVALTAGAVVLAVAGMGRAALTGGDVRRAAVEMVGIGLVSAFAGYLIGQLLQAPPG